MIAIRGAIQVGDNHRHSIYEATCTLLSELQRRNRFEPAQVVSALFTMTPDLDRDFPARAARGLGWGDVPMLGAVETSVPGAPGRIVRVLLHVRTEHAPRHVYLDGAESLRPDRAAVPVGDADRPTEAPRVGPVLVCGLGLIGGSVALALARDGRVGPVIGYDADPRALHHARAARAIAEQVADPKAALDRVALVILALPVEAILSWLTRWGPTLRSGLVVMDVGGAKRRIVEALDRLPPGVEAIGTHPMAGSERGGFTWARRDLFEGAPWAVVEGERTGETARRYARTVIEAAGATPRLIDAAGHDRAIAQMSQLPYLIACVLAQGADGDSESAVRSLFGPGFRDMTRLAGCEPRVMADVLVSNWDGVRAEVARFRDALDLWMERLERDASSAARVERVLAGARRARCDLLVSRRRGVAGLEN